jgi:CxxC-x17-CxxC domain-containing protein
MNDFKRGGFGKKQFGRPSFGGRPAFQRSGGGFGRPQSQMHSATCANCGKATEVPFKPDGTRPIYCRDCFGNGNDSRPPRLPSGRAGEQQRPAFQRSVPMQHSVPMQVQRPMLDPRIDDLQKHLSKVLVKLDQILLEIAVAKAQAGAETTLVKKKKTAKKK